MAHGTTREQRDPQRTPAETGPAAFRGDGRALAGFILALLTFWLFAQTLLNIGPQVAADIGMSSATMNTAIALSALFSGMLIVAWGGVADRYGRRRVFTIGAALNIVGCAAIVAATGAAAVPLFLAGRVLQGLSIGAIMPSSMALVGAYWSGEDRERASSLWAFGTFGGSGLASIVGGFLADSVLGWRSIFVLSAIFAALAIALTRHVPESAPSSGTRSRFDFLGVITLAVALLALQLVITHGSDWGWSSLATLLFALVAVVFAAGFFAVETQRRAPLIDLRVFTNVGFAAATASNFLVNLTVGTIPLVMWALQRGHGMAASTAGYLTLAYPIVLIATLIVAVTCVRKFGEKATMATGPFALAIAALLLSLTGLPSTTYYVIVVVAFAFFGAGLALYATPSINMALSELPPEQAGAGSGVYKMASSLGGGIGVAISGSVFAGLVASGASAAAAARTGLLINTAFVALAGLLVLTMLSSGRPAERQQSRQAEGKQ